MHFKCYQCVQDRTKLQLHTNSNQLTVSPNTLKFKLSSYVMHHSSKILSLCYSLISHLHMKYVTYRCQDCGSVGSVYVFETPIFLELTLFGPAWLPVTADSFVTYLCTLYFVIYFNSFYADFKFRKFRGYQNHSLQFWNPQIFNPAAPLMLPIEMA